MSEFELINQLPIEITSLLPSEALAIGLHHLLGEILSGVREIATGLRDGKFSSEKIGSQNSFGDNQLDVDVKTDEIVFDRLIKSGLVYVAASEETPVERDCNGTQFSVAFDPLDGSSIGNFTR